MQKLTDWNALWRELVEIKEKNHRAPNGQAVHPDLWADRAVEYRESVRRKWVRPDSSRDFILSRIDSDSTVLDIGAGTGAWSILLARKAKRVTAIEPSPSMIRVLLEDLEKEHIDNVTLTKGSWPDVPVEKHDYSLCSHAMYACPDFASFVLKMVSCTRRMCFLLIRATLPNGVRAQAAQHIWGQPLDSPNFTIAYNILLQLGIHANVQMENTGLWKPRTSSSLQEALESMHRFFGLGDSKEHDAYLMDLLRRRLVWEDGRYVWPPEVRSALVYWEVGQ